MKKIFLLFAAITMTMALHAQSPSWTPKVAKSMFTLKTFDKNGQLLASATGFFLTDNGEAVCSYGPFRGAERAVVIDAGGKEWPVVAMTGANDMYDVAKFRVQVKKAAGAAVAKSKADNGSTVWILPYSAGKKAEAFKASVKSSETFLDSYAYYTLQTDAKATEQGAAVVGDNGEIIGLLQPSSSAQKTDAYAISAQFAADLRINGLSFNDPAMRATGIALAVPDNRNDALLALYVAGNTLDAQAYGDFLERFIQQYPSAADGYVYRARRAAIQQHYDEAEKDLQQAVRMADNKADAHYQYAQLVMQYALQPSDKAYGAWTLDKALVESREAYKADAQDIYLQQQAQILFAQKQYDEACRLYMQLTQGELRNANLFYAASQCKALQGDTLQQLALLDSAVALYSKPYLKEAAPYLLARAQARHDAGKYRLAVADYNEYGTLMAAQLTAPFYYMREQAEVAGRLYQQGLNDISKAIEMAPQEPLYLAEKASLQIRVAQYAEAIEPARQLVSLAPDNSDGYYFLGAAQWLSGHKTEGMANLNKAKEMGNEMVQTFIDRHTK